MASKLLVIADQVQFFTDLLDQRWKANYTGKPNVFFHTENMEECSLTTRETLGKMLFLLPLSLVHAVSTSAILICGYKLMLYWPYFLGKGTTSCSTLRPCQGRPAAKDLHRKSEAVHCLLAAKGDLCGSPIECYIGIKWIKWIKMLHCRAIMGISA